MITDSTLAAIVDANPDTARVLERHQLDYCCGGRRTLAQACAERDLDATAVLAELDAVEPAPEADWTTMDLTALVDHIEGVHHGYLHQELPRLAALTDKVVGVHGARHPELLALSTAYTALKDDFEPHLMKEERILFPMIRELAEATEPPTFHCGSLANPIHMMLLEHDQTGDLLAAVREITDGFQPPTDACGSYRALYRDLEALETDTHLHIHKENDVLFPAVLQLEHEIDG